MRTAALVAVAAALLGACAPPSNEFAATVDAQVADADPGAVGIPIAVTPGEITFAEGDTETLQVHLTGAPDTPVTITIGDAGGIVEVEPEALTFDADDFGNDKLVTITAIDDADAADGDGAILLDDDGAVVARQSVSVHVDDLDLLELVASPDTLSIGEAGGGDVLVHLSAAPPGELLVDVTVNDPTAATVDPPQLRFDATSYDHDQTIHVTGAEDADVANESTAIKLDGGNTVPQKSVLLGVVDNDVLNIQVDSGTINLTEGGTSGQIGVSLTQDPGGSLTVTLAETSAGFHLGQTTVQFSSQNYGEVHHVAVIPDDDVDVTPEQGVVTLSAAPLDDVHVTINVADDDTQEILHTVGGSLAVAEGSTASFDVSLRWKPAATTTIVIDSDDDTSASPVQASVTITPTDYAGPHPVVISGVQDNDLAGETPHLTLSAADIASKTINVAVTDNDEQTIVLAPAAGVTITEGGTSTQLTAKLGFQPPAATAVTVSSNSAAVVVGTTTLNFSTSNWGAAQSVQLSAPADSNTTDESATISFVTGSTSASVTATVDDTTVITNYGWSTWFNNSDAIPAGYAIAYKLTVPVNTTIDKFGLIADAAGGTAKMALYRDSANAPGQRVVASNAATGITQGAPNPTLIDVPDTALTAGTYWIAIRLESTTAIGYSSSVTALQCSKSQATYTEAWTDPFGASSCSTAGVLNLFLVTYQ